MPAELRDTIWASYERNRARRIDEPYPATSTGMNGHEVRTSLVYYDWDMDARDHVAREHVWQQMTKVLDIPQQSFRHNCANEEVFETCLS